MPKQTLTGEDLRLIRKLVGIEFDEKLEEKLEAKLNEKLRFVPSKELFLAEMAKLMNEVKDMREEQTMHTGQHRGINDKLDGHDRRIKKLETVIAN